MNVIIEQAQTGFLPFFALRRKSAESCKFCNFFGTAILILCRRAAPLMRETEIPTQSNTDAMASKTLSRHKLEI
jgi:hypothetical protein